METIWRNLGFGLRLIRRDASFYATAVLILALGIGGNTAIFSVVYGTLLAPLPYPNPDRVVVVWSRIHGNHNGIAAGDFLDWKEQSTVFESLTAFSGRPVNLSSSGKAESVPAEEVWPGWFGKTFGVGPFLGRDFLPEESELGKEHEAILAHRLWKSRFGGDPGIVGKQIRANGEMYTVVGVLPAGSYDRLPGQIFLPLAFKPEQVNHEFHWLLVTGRLKPGVTLAQGQANMDAVTRHIAQVYPKSNGSWGASVEPLHNDFLNKNVREALWVLLGAVGVILLICCTNIANLLLAKGLAREREVAVRASVGASRGQVFRQFLTESVLLAVVGGAAGIGLGWALLRVIVAAMPRMLPTEADVRLSPPVLLFSVAAAVASGVIFGCAPAWHMAHLNLNEALKEGGHAASSSRRNRMRRALVTIEIALAMTLLASAGLLIHSFWNLNRSNMGFRKEHVLTFWLPVLDTRFSEPAQMVAFYRNLIDRMEAIPGIYDAAVSSGIPVRGTGFGMPFSITGRPPGDLSGRPGAPFNIVTPEYFKTFGITIVSGRSFTELDNAGSIRVAMVNENFVKKYLSGLDPLKQRLVIEQLIPGVTKLGPLVEWQIVGVFHNVSYVGPEYHDDWAEIDVPFWQSPWPQASIAVRTAGDPQSVVKDVAAVVNSIDPDLPLHEVKTMDQVLDQSFASDSFEAALLAAFAGLALLLAVVGIYGVVRFEVAQRTREIGLRMALGASRERVLQLILANCAMMAASGLALGLVGAYFVERAMRSMLYGVGAVDYGDFAIVAVALLAAALVACYIPARKATRVDPMTALRYE